MLLISKAYIAIALLLLVSGQVVVAKHVGIWYMRCNPYTKPDGSQAVGAKGPCDNGCFAWNSGQQPGTVTYRGPGNRDQDAGCDRKPCNQDTGLPQYNRFGNTCDEYPMAVTYRGPNNFRTLRCVPNVENSSQGGQLSGFRSRVGLEAGDTFTQGWMWDKANAPYFCANAQAGASNPDHSEFKYTGGVFSNARRHTRSLTESSLFEPIIGTIGRFAGRRDFLMSNGEIATLAASDSTIDIHSFWADGESPLSIVRELDFADVVAMVRNATGF
ncbi:hypothetical protein EX895_003001 [Sporisorium graminicola]|uniref:Deoxyribonuclease NucA/NucB domain-containing protein n=1 Tax=Sporisorium graminicola TaxID=280036 RepID=A0A4U7KTG8_9BASI|nr:hypothetical protein EX895_003001 [Sporisorium graminicola]TKY87905.1 hypothetical protein EX895_003001 [Sporisorium graminicola]